MTAAINTIFFDLGGTLRILHKDKAYQKKAKEMMAALAGTNLNPEDFHAMIEERYIPYRDWALRADRESNDAELWLKWLLPDYDQALISRNSHELTFWYRQCKGVRLVVDHGIEVIHTLHERGYHLGIISNLIGENEIPDWIEADGLSPYLDCVVLSSRCGIRKPDPRIYDLACEQVGVKAEQCASVADNLDRDITGARAAHMGACVLFISPEKKHQVALTSENRPDYVIQDFLDLLELFPESEKRS